jgi:predicted Zn-dependent protease
MQFIRILYFASLTFSYTLHKSRWNKNNFSWSTNGDNRLLALSKSAFSVWKKYANLTFNMKSDCVDVDICISFEKQVHEGCVPFDGKGGILAHAFGPGFGQQKSGNVHLDVDESWNKNRLFSVLVHEIGHSLGIGHSNVTSAIMYPFLNLVSCTLNEDDILAIQYLYGKNGAKKLYNIFYLLSIVVGFVIIINIK